MKIQNYSFGNITIEGKNFDYDVIISKKIKKWWRKQGHYMIVSDITSYIDIDKEKPETIVIGTGYSGLMEVSDEVKNFIKDRGIRLVVQKTIDAVKTFNKLESKIGFFHLTC